MNLHDFSICLWLLDKDKKINKKKNFIHFMCGIEWDFHLYASYKSLELMVLKDYA